MDDDHMRTDLILMEILRERKTITGFLDTVFGFLRRNTDFYYVRKDASESIGFLKGVREQILFGAMQRYDPECSLNNMTTDDENIAPPAVQEVEVETENHVEIQMPKQSSENAIEKTERKSIVEKTEEEFFTPADYKNGACFDNYCWSQTLSDVELHVKLPSKLQTAKSLHIEIKAESITVRSRLQPDCVILSGQLSNKYKHNDAVWTIAENKLLISFDKIREHWWETIFKHENSIDMKSIDCERYIDELPEDSQAAIYKLRAEQMEQDNLNNRQEPCADENEKMEKLRIAWDADDSPFKGQPFDPNLIKFT